MFAVVQNCDEIVSQNKNNNNIANRHWLRMARFLNFTIRFDREALVQLQQYFFIRSYSPANEHHYRWTFQRLENTVRPWHIINTEEDASR